MYFSTHKSSDHALAPASSRSDLGLHCWRWHGLQKDGTRISGRLAATSREQALHMLSGEGIWVIRVRQQRQLYKRGEHVRRWILQLTQLGELLTGGVALLTALSHLSARASQPGTLLKWARLHAGVSEGRPLSDVLTEVGLGHIFPMAPALIAVGEETGKLSSILLDIAAFLEGEQVLYQRILTPVRYPAFTLIASLVVMLGMLKFIVPTFAQLYGDHQTTLAVPTRLLFTLADMLETPPWWLYPMSGVVVGLLILGWRLKQRWRYRLPLLGNLWRMHDRTTLLAMLGLSLQHHLPIDKCVSLLATRRNGKALAKVLEQLRNGRGVAAAFSQANLFDAMIIDMMSSGEHSGCLPSAMKRAASYEKQRLERHLAMLEAWIEPVLMVAMACVIGFAVIALYLPVFDLGNQL